MIAVIQNDPEVPAGTYAEQLEGEKIPFRLVKMYAGDVVPAVGDLRAAVVLGGAMGVHDTARHPFLLDVTRFVGGAVERGLPFLGICLGGQLLADALGAAVTSGAHGEKGTLPVVLTPAGEADPLFAGISREFLTFQWHDDTFAVPPGGTLLASSPACPHQAFRVGNAAYGLQFHPEVTPAIVDTWARWDHGTAPLAERFLADFEAGAPSYRPASQRLFANFLRIAGLV
ncbi:type 1 glutamine amidotransferase [Geobacter pickeringii]|uniref:Glutamine amidotransferase n=1 Tax=Geobacter pickeringii TaxID=345632 RepID=A0A0B5BIX6_9BACT|nr:type 1 glutamine amidotransferase [Geobacter pickeringii]AJE04006.1 glutamine amidotransferase [Geobacter pickeringii]